MRRMARFRSRELHQWHRYYRGRWDDWWTHVYATPGIAEANAHSFAGSQPILECRFTSRKSSSRKLMDRKQNGGFRAEIAENDTRDERRSGRQHDPLP